MTERAPLPILHYISLEKIGGVERYFTGFLSHRSERYAPRHGVVLREPMHPIFRDEVVRNTEGTWYRKRLGGLKIPKYPSSLRWKHQTRVARKFAPGIALIWNLLGDVQALETAKAAGLTTIYWERGLGWFNLIGEAQSRAFLKGVDGVIANSHAGRRILELGWNHDGPIVVHKNALRADATPPRRTPKTGPVGRPFRVGVVGRLLPFKGISLAVHAVKKLVREGLDVELRIAGSGALESELNALISSLALQSYAKLVGEVADIDAFFDRVDIVVHPALREPCSNVVVEAMARGCPVIAGLVDGMPELIVDGHTGVVLEPTLPLSDYAQFGAHAGKMPEFVYDPKQDTVVEPRLLDPSDIAREIKGYLEDSERYVRESGNAADHIRTNFDPREQLESVYGTLNRFLAEAWRDSVQANVAQREPRSGSEPDPLAGTPEPTEPPRGGPFAAAPSPTVRQQGGPFDDPSSDN
ncbi:MAG: glycosyltransferase family 4 protein [bacterium]|nr:glycosyltransferase family 4 protein [bacterium]